MGRDVSVEICAGAPAFVCADRDALVHAHALGHLREYEATGSERLRTLSLMIWTIDSRNLPSSPALVTTDLAVRHLTEPLTRDQAPVSLRLERLELRPGDLLPGPPAGDVRLVGRLPVNDGPAALRVVRAHQERQRRLRARPTQFQ